MDETRASLYAGMATVRPGTAVSAIGRAIEAHANKHGLGVVREFIGHGVGTEFHSNLQIPHYYEDLGDPLFKSAIALVHQRFSTNTFPTWERAQPFQYLAHNGEINTLRGNVNWMRSREATLSSPLFGGDISKITPIIDETGSDSAMLDDALTLLIQSGRPSPHALMMLIPEAWSSHPHMEGYKKASTSSTRR